jgi:UDP-glucose 4-epimerase
MILKESSKWGPVGVSASLDYSGRMSKNRGGEVAAVPSSWPRTLARKDVVLHKGQLSLVNNSLTPAESMLDDLMFVRRVIESTGIEYLLVRGNDERPVIAVDWKQRAVLQDALAAAMATEPFYSKTVSKNGGPALFVADGRLSTDAAARVFRLFRPRVEPVGNLRYGATTGVQLEFWSFTETEIHAPVENSLTRRVIPRHELVESTVERYGVEWRTVEPMFDRLASDITFDIDIVFSWVDGTDLEFQRARARRMQSYVVGEGDDHEARFRQIDELRYALRSVYVFAPWIRRIFIATDSPVPHWLADHPKVTVVRSEEFFVDPSVLPTHNSQAVESQLHHIPGLAEHFLYSNDDMFFGRPVTPEMFFSPGGITRFIEAETRIGLGTSAPERSGFENAARVNRNVLLERFGVTITRHLEHSAAPLRKSVLAELEREFPEEFARTAANAFRNRADISVTNSLYHYYALVTGRAVAQTDARVKYIDTTTRAGLKAMNALIKKRSYDMFCLNDGSFPEVEAEERTRAVRDFLDRYFAIAAPWEKPSTAVDVQAV